MASNWFRDFDDDDFFSKPSRLSLLRPDSWEDSLDKFHTSSRTRDILSSFDERVKDLRDRMNRSRRGPDRGRGMFESSRSSRRSSRADSQSEDNLDGIASPTPSSLHSAPFHFPDNNGHVTFPNSMGSCSNVSECSDRSADSICTDRSQEHSQESEALPGGGEKRKTDSRESWLDRNEGGQVVGEGNKFESVTSQVLPNSFQVCNFFSI